MIKYMLRCGILIEAQRCINYAEDPDLWNIKAFLNLGMENKVCDIKTYRKLKKGIELKDDSVYIQLSKKLKWKLCECEDLDHEIELIEDEIYNAFNQADRENLILAFYKLRKLCEQAKNIAYYGHCFYVSEMLINYFELKSIDAAWLDFMLVAYHAFDDKLQSVMKAFILRMDYSTYYSLERQQQLMKHLNIEAATEWPLKFMSIMNLIFSLDYLNAYAALERLEKDSYYQQFEILLFKFALSKLVRKQKTESIYQELVELMADVKCNKYLKAKYICVSSQVFIYCKQYEQAKEILITGLASELVDYYPINTFSIHYLNTLNYKIDCRRGVYEDFHKSYLVQLVYEFYELKNAGVNARKLESYLLRHIAKLTHCDNWNLIDICTREMKLCTEISRNYKCFYKWLNSPLLKSRKLVS